MMLCWYQNGYVFTLGGGALSMKSFKQKCISRFMMDALDKVGRKVQCLRHL